jgi:predicted DNA-binding transcriptional regulator AlpA
MQEHPYLLRFADLKARRIVSSWPQVKRLVDNHGFPCGFMLSPAVRVWDEADVADWVNQRRAALQRGAAFASAKPDPLQAREAGGRGPSGRAPQRDRPSHGPDAA